MKNPISNTLKYGEYLLGSLISHNNITGIISEVEAYIGPEDKASHCHNNRKTKRTEPMYKEEGTIYIYKIYGIYHCLNIVSETEGYPAAILIRSVFPLKNSLDQFSRNRFSKNYQDLSSYQKNNLANGPGKVTIAFNIPESYNDKKINDNTFSLNKKFIIPKNQIDRLPRINIPYAEEYTENLWRFKIKPLYLAKLIEDSHK